MRVAGQQLELAGTVDATDVVNGPLIGVDKRAQFAEQHSPDRTQLALALQHACEPGEVGLQPVLLAVALGGFAQVRNHCIDIVFQFSHFAASLGLN